MEPFSTLKAPFVALPFTNIDTDQIIPARFLTQTHKKGLGSALFFDKRYDGGGVPHADHVLNQGGAPSILVAGPNFGCGSSREHAVWALQDYGFRVVVSPSFGDIFKSNAVKNGLLALEVSPFFYTFLMANESAVLHIDLHAREIGLESGPSETFAIDPFTRYCLLHGLDQLGYILAQDAAISAYERQRL